MVNRKKMKQLYLIAGKTDSELEGTEFGFFTSRELAQKGYEALPEEFREETEVVRSNLDLNTIKVDGKTIVFAKSTEKRFQLISVTRSELEIVESFYDTHEEAHKAMIEDILISTPYESLEEIIEDADAGLCGFSDDEAWAETNQSGTGQWKIVEIPAQKSIRVRTPEGVIVAEAKGALDDYPGIWIFEGDNKPLNMIAAVEYNTSDKRLQTEAYQTGVDEPRSILITRPETT